MQIPDKQMNAEHKIIRQEMKELVEKAIDNLPEKYRIVYMLSEVEGLPAQEVCSTLDVTHNNFKVRLHRAKAMLKENLFDLAGDANIFEFGNRRCDRVVQSVMSLVLSGERPNRL
jgi:DNA-directed RNA polymerase specialized sigma24 family protein